MSHVHPLSSLLKLSEGKSLTHEGDSLLPKNQRTTVFDFTANKVLDGDTTGYQYIGISRQEPKPSEVRVAVVFGKKKITRLHETHYIRAVKSKRGGELTYTYYVGNKETGYTDPYVAVLVYLANAKVRNNINKIFDEDANADMQHYRICSGLVSVLDNF